MNSLTNITVTYLLNKLPLQCIEYICEERLKNFWWPHIQYIGNIFDNISNDDHVVSIDIMKEFCSTFPFLIKKNNDQHHRIGSGLNGEIWIFRNEKSKILPTDDGLYSISTFDLDYRIHQNIIDFLESRKIYTGVGIILKKI